METEFLMLAIIQSQDAEPATRALTQAGLRVTRVGSVGGFLRTENATLLLGLKRDEMPRAIQQLAEHCHERTTFVNAIAEAASWHAGYIAPIEITVGGATVFTLPVEHFARFGAQPERAVSAEQEAGMLHHHFPCLASMGIDSDYGDTLMHVSGNILRDEVGEQVRPFKQIAYLRPGTKSEDQWD